MPGMLLASRPSYPLRHVAQLEFLDLARAGLGQLREHHVPRHFVARRVPWRHQAMISSAVALAPGFSSTKAQGVSPHFSSGLATTAAACDRGMLVEHVLDLDRRDVLAARDDDVLGAVLELDIAVRVQHAEIAGMEPAALEGLVRWPSDS